MTDEKFQRRWGDFRDLVSHLFLESGHACPEADVAWYPATDAYETEEEFVARVDLSGVRREDLRLRLHRDVLDVRGLRREAPPPGPRTFHKMEIPLGPFRRTVRMPERFVGGEVTAHYRDGILEIRVRPRPGSEREDIEIELDLGESG